ncbi:MAG: hypothetical protein MUC43_12700 [Pirellula sp.]|jgi:hypothetical protein|nr:hypothetical protein [Pirellula sp.]
MLGRFFFSNRWKIVGAMMVCAVISLMLPLRKPTLVLSDPLLNGGEVGSGSDFSVHFSITNESRANRSIAKILRSCNCTNILSGNGEDLSLPIQIDTRETLSFIAKVSATNPGPSSTNVRFVVDNGEILQLLITYTVRGGPEVIAIPAVVDIGKTRTARLLAGGNRGDLTEIERIEILPNSAHASVSRFTETYSGPKPYDDWIPTHEITVAIDETTSVDSTPLRISTDFLGIDETRVTSVEIIDSSMLVCTPPVIVKTNADGLVKTIRIDGLRIDSKIVVEETGVEIVEQHRVETTGWFRLTLSRNVLNSKLPGSPIRMQEVVTNDGIARQVNLFIVD